METDSPTPPEQAPAESDPDTQGQDLPEWLENLRYLYESVVEEPLPDSLRELLSRLDDAD